jgi:cardiolipin synthase
MASTDSPVVALSARAWRVSVRFLRFVHIAIALTTSRLLLIPFAAYYLLAGQDDVSLPLFLCAAGTDILDGMVARALDDITPLGAALDPIADKLLIGTMLCCFAATGAVGLWPLAILAAVQCLRWTGGGIYFHRTRIVIHAKADGKVTNWLFVSAITVLFLAPQFALIPLLIAMFSYALSTALLIRHARQQATAAIQRLTHGGTHGSRR